MIIVKSNIFYTYAFLRKNGTPYYIGKGSNGRIWDKRNRCCNPLKDKSRIIYLKQNLTEEAAFKHEIYMIAVYGRKDLGTGILLNRTNGGEGASGHIQTEEVRAKWSAAMTPEVRARISVSNKGRKRSDESRAKMSASAKGNKSALGRKHTQE